MDGGEFKFEDCLKKHLIRSDLWLPHAQARKKHVEQRGVTRRFKYLTFCAPGALDVLLLHKKRVIRTSSDGDFDTVYFFNRSATGVTETRKRIKGAHGFPADFVRILHASEEGDEEEDDGGDDNPLEIPQDAPNTKTTRQAERDRIVRSDFKKAFPFDLINLDLEQYIFRPTEVVPGKLISGLSKMFEWQKRKGMTPEGKQYELDEFTLMFTTRVGPTGLSAEYIQYLRDTCLQANLNNHPELEEPFLKRSSGRDVATFFAEDFDAAFKIAAPKSLIELALEHDWHVAADKGVEVYEFQRDQAEGAPYTMLHVAMTVRRQKPKKTSRLPGTPLPSNVVTEHVATIQKLFSDAPVSVESLVAAKQPELQADLTALFQHREKILAK